MRRVILVAALAYLALPGGLSAQDLADLCDNFPAPANGQWAEYRAVGNGQEGNIRFAILPAAGSDGKVLELQVSDFGGQSMIMQVDVPDYPFTSSEITRVVVKAPGQPAMVLPTQLAQLDQMDLPMPTDEECRQAELLGMEEVEVAGATYDTYHIRPANQTRAEVWMTTEVPFGIVKAVAEDGEMTLLAHGNGAVSSITETPIRMPGM